MALLAFSQLFSAKDDKIIHVQTKENHESALAEFGSWLGDVLDVKCCAVRDTSEHDPRMICADRPTIKQVQASRRPSASSVSDTSHGSHSTHCEQDAAAHRHWFNSEVDCQPLHSSHQVPAELVDKVAKLVNENPYVAREIGERGARSVRMQFMKQCMLHRHSQCQQIWGNLNEQDRLDFLQVFHITGTNPETFFLNIMEPDAHTWTEEVADFSFSELESRSDSGSANSGDCRVTRSNCSSSTRASDKVALAPKKWYAGSIEEKKKPLPPKALLLWGEGGSAKRRF